MPGQTKPVLISRASSISRALDEIGDRWCLLILQEVFWGINTFNDMLAATGASRGVLTDRLNWLQQVHCLKKETVPDTPRRPVYHLTRKSIELYHNGLMAVNWERKYYSTPQLDSVELTHRNCGQSFLPIIQCVACDRDIVCDDVFYRPGPGARQDQRAIKTRRRSSKTVPEHAPARALYRNLVDLLGDRWTANLVALAFHRLSRFDEFHAELPVATNILADRLKFLVQEGVFYQRPYQTNPPRYDYRLTEKGKDLYPYFLTLLQWGDRWCDKGGGKPMLLQHGPCGQDLVGEVRCNRCQGKLVATEVQFSL